MIGWELLVLAAILWVAKQIIGPLIGQQIKGSVPDYTASKARAAVKLLPPELAEQYEQDWLAELHALANKPFSAIRYAGGLRRAARRIASQTPGFDRHRPSLPAVESLRRRRMSKRTAEQNAILAARIFALIFFLFVATIVFFVVSLAFRPDNRVTSMDAFSVVGGIASTAVLLLALPGLVSSARLRVRKSKGN